MAFRPDEILLIEAAIADFVEKRRPREEIRHKLDLAYRIRERDQSVENFSVRPDWRNQGTIMESAAAKAKYRRPSATWDFLWMRSDLKWHIYEPHPQAVLFEEFLAVVEEDAHCCFWG
jgi:hypothetical protein